MPKAVSAHERFWRFVTPDNPHACWIWHGAKRNGYGVLGRGSRIGGTAPLLYAHRVSFEIHHGEIEEGSLVCHHCDNRACVNPSHLYEGTHCTNLRDRYERQDRSHCRNGHKRTADSVRLVYWRQKSYVQCQKCIAQRRARKRKVAT